MYQPDFTVYIALGRTSQPPRVACRETNRMTDTSKFITFVLGAGASFEVGMPTGYELKAKIASSLSFKGEDFQRLGGGDDHLREALQQMIQRQESEASKGGHLNAAKLINGVAPIHRTL